MAGILDNKTRMMDTILTREGRRQIAAGDLKIKFVTFTDRHTFYRQDDEDAADDADNRIFMESFHRPQDQIIFETDNEGRFMPFDGADIKIRRGKLWKDSGSAHMQITGSNVPEAIYELLESSANNFRDQQIIGSKDIFDETHDFILNTNNVAFQITDTAPFRGNDISEIDIEKVESLHQDQRLQHLPFYQYMPPVNKPKPGYVHGEPLGHYARLNQDPIQTYEELARDLAKRDYVDLRYIDTSRENNLVMQFLETKPDGVEKLALIDFGEFPSDSPASAGKHVYFAGKIFEDATGMQTFVNMFTIVFE